MRATSHILAAFFSLLLWLEAPVRAQTNAIAQLCAQPQITLEYPQTDWRQNRLVLGGSLQAVQLVHTAYPSQNVQCIALAIDPASAEGKRLLSLAEGDLNGAVAELVLRGWLRASPGKLPEPQTGSNGNWQTLLVDNLADTASPYWAQVALDRSDASRWVLAAWVMYQRGSGQALLPDAWEAERQFNTLLDSVRR